MLVKVDVDEDGKISKLELAAFFLQTFGPYLLVIIGVFAPASETLKASIVSGGLAAAGVTKASELRRPKSKYLNFPQDEVIAFAPPKEESASFETPFTNDDSTF